MRIKIDSDAFNIVDRIKEIDNGYFIVLNTDKDCFELHNEKQVNTYCLTIPYNQIDVRIIFLIYKTMVGNVDNIMYEIDTNNLKIERNNNDYVKNYTEYTAKEVFQFANNSSKIYNHDKAFTTTWR